MDARPVGLTLDDLRRLVDIAATRRPGSAVRRVLNALMSVPVPVMVGGIIERAWPDDEPDEAEALIHWAVWRLRRLLAPAGYRIARLEGRGGEPGFYRIERI